MRIVVISQSTPLEQMISSIVARGVDVEIVGDADTLAESGQIIAQEHPDWLFLLADSQHDMIEELREVRAEHKHLCIAALHEDGKRVRILSGTDAHAGDEPKLDEKWDEMSVSDFVASLLAEPAIPEETPRLTEKKEHRA